MIKSLSIIIPFFNEKERVKSSLIEIKKFIKKNRKIKIEVLLVDDGSTDNTKEKILSIFKKLKVNKKNFQILILPRNQGKGKSLQIGVSKMKNDWALTTDMDLSVPLEQLIQWSKRDFIHNKNEIYFGSRELEDSIVKTKTYRKILGIFFRFLSNLFLSVDLRDTQCGFKLYRKKHAKYIFSKMKSERFEHDLEIVLLAKKLNYEVIELPVEWEHRSGSKLNILVDPWKMFFGILKLWYKNVLTKR